jgi:hypothetical protein
MGHLGIFFYCTELDLLKFYDNGLSHIGILLESFAGKAKILELEIFFEQKHMSFKFLPHFFQSTAALHLHVIFYNQ